MEAIHRVLAYVSVAAVGVGILRLNGTAATADGGFSEEIEVRFP